MQVPETAPTASFELNKNLRKMAKRGDLMAEYFRLFDPAQLPSIIRDSFSKEVMAQILSGLEVRNRVLNSDALMLPRKFSNKRFCWCSVFSFFVQCRGIER